MLRKIMPFTFILLISYGVSMGISGDLFRKNDRPEEPSVYVGMATQQVFAEFKERGFSEIAAKRTLINGNGKILYSYKPRKDHIGVKPTHFTL